MAEIVEIFKLNSFMHHNASEFADQLLRNIDAEMKSDVVNQLFSVVTSNGSIFAVNVPSNHSFVKVLAAVHTEILALSKYLVINVNRNDEKGLKSLQNKFEFPMTFDFGSILMKVPYTSYTDEHAPITGIMPSS